MKVLVTGDRDWEDIALVAEKLEKLPSGTIIVNGACRGADNICAAIAESLGFVLKTYPADWTKYGRGAGPIRNQMMIDKEHRSDEPINLCLAFHDNIKASKGTRDMVTRAEKAKIPTTLIRHE